jgi:hypothetical protein
MAGRRNSPRHEENVAEFHARKPHRDPDAVESARLEREAAREAARELAREQREARQRALAEPLQYKKAQSKYDPEKADEICLRLINGETLSEISRHKHMPTYGTMIRWIRDYEVFRKAYIEAMEASAYTNADEVASVRRSVLVGDIDPDVARVANQSSQWLASKRNAKAFGDGKDSAKAPADLQPILNITLSK